MEENTPTGYIGLFWIDDANDKLFGVKRIPIRLGMTGLDPDTLSGAEMTIIDYSHNIHWRDLQDECVIPSHVETLYKGNDLVNVIPKGRVSYVQDINTYVVLLDLGYENNPEIQKQIKSRFLLPRNANVVFEPDFDPPLRKGPW